MKYFLCIAVAISVALTFTARPASAAKFKTASGTVQADGSLSISFSEIGLGSRQGVNYQVTADSTATYGCINGGGNHPKATNKTNVSQQLGATASGTATRNGTFTCSGCIVIGPPV